MWLIHLIEPAYCVWANQLIVRLYVLHGREQSAAVDEHLSLFLVSILKVRSQEVEGKEEEDDDQNHREALKDSLRLIMVENDSKDGIAEQKDCEDDWDQPDNTVYSLIIAYILLASHQSTTIK